MPRCCASINDPNNPRSIVVYVEVDLPDAVAGKAAAEQAALAAFQAGGFGGPPPPVNLKTKTGKIPN
jgi:hypothetical protein